jgi:hypothetical protein
LRWREGRRRRWWWWWDFGGDVWIECLDWDSMAVGRIDVACLLGGGE